MDAPKKTTYLFILALLVVGYWMIAPAKVVANPVAEDSAKVSDLLNDVKVEARLLGKDVVEIQSYMMSDLSWQSHADKLNEIRNHINKAGKLLAQLNDERSAGSPWQQKAIDEIHPLLQELASNTQSALEHFTDNKDRFHMGDTYRSYLKANVTVSKELAALISDYVDYGFHKSEFNRLGEKVVASER